jgi:hypothetical protein
MGAFFAWTEPDSSSRCERYLPGDFMRRTLCLPFLLLVSLAACADQTTQTTSDDSLRALSREEALEDLAQVGSTLRAFYGPLEYKKERFGFDLDAELAKAKAAIELGEDEADRVRPVYELLAKLQDGHVSYSYPLRSDESAEASLPFVVTPVEGQWVVARVNAPETTIKRGDTLVAIDGKGTRELEESIAKIVWSGRREAARHGIGVRMTNRPFYVPRELKVRDGATAQVILQREDGEFYVRDIPWTFRKGIAGQVLPPRPVPTAQMPSTDLAYSPETAYVIGTEAGTDATTFEVGSQVPYFLTPQVREALGIVEVAPKTETLTTMGVSLPPPPAPSSIPFRAFKYKHADKTILLVRIPSYTVPNNGYMNAIGWLSALIKESSTPAATPPESLADTPADVVVIDETHNPGGSVPYVSGLARLFISSPIPNFVQANHADRPWIASWLQQANAADAAAQPLFLERMRALEQAHDEGKWLGPFAPLAGSIQGPNAPLSVEAVAGSDMLTPYPLAHWSGPLLVLHDELSGSGGDAFPLLLQNGGAAKTFGATTSGLGGSVQPMATLAHSGGTLNVTRGLFGAHNPQGPVPTRLIENNGVVPDYPHTVTVADFRAGYVGFAKAFSDVAVTLQR